jgi:hypothetical protein
VSIRQAPPDKVASREASSIEQEFAVRKALLARARPIEKVCELLDIKSRQTLHNWISQGKIIALPENGRLLLPLWQFEAGTDDKLMPGFSEALQALNRTSFSAAHWFTSPNVQLGNKPPIVLLRAGEIAKVVAETRRCASLKARRLSSKKSRIVSQLATAADEHRIEYYTVGNTTTIRLDAVEANAHFRPGRASDTFGPVVPVIELRLSRTSLTIGADAMPPGTTTYRTPQPRKAPRNRQPSLRNTSG